jgi:hypothetical protein
MPQECTNLQCFGIVKKILETASSKENSQDSCDGFLLGMPQDPQFGPRGLEKISSVGFLIGMPQKYGELILEWLSPGNAPEKWPNSTPPKKLRATF